MACHLGQPSPHTHTHTSLSVCFHMQPVFGYANRISIGPGVHVHANLLPLPNVCVCVCMCACTNVTEIIIVMCVCVGCVNFRRSRQMEKTHTENSVQAYQHMINDVLNVSQQQRQNFKLSFVQTYTCTRGWCTLTNTHTHTRLTCRCSNVQPDRSIHEHSPHVRTTRICSPDTFWSKVISAPPSRETCQPASILTHEHERTHGCAMHCISCASDIGIVPSRSHLMGRWDFNTYRSTRRDALTARRDETAQLSHAMPVH